MKKIKVKMIFDFVCPWCYLGFKQIHEIKKNYDLEIEYSTFQLNYNVPEQGLDIVTFTGESKENLKRRHDLFLKKGQKYHLDFKERDNVYDSHPALLLFQYFKNQNQEEAYMLAIWYAYFEKGLNIAKVDVLQNIVLNLGYDNLLVDDILKDTTYQKMYELDQKISDNYYFETIPAYIINDDEIINGILNDSDFTNIFDK